MKIRAGKRYVTRDGRVTGPMRRSHSSGMLPPLMWVAFVDDLPKYWFRGGVWLNSGHPLDLIAEHKDPAP